MTEKIIQQLVEIYQRFEWWHKERLTKEQAEKYHEILLSKNRIILCIHDSVVLGYVESWRVNFEQLGRLICHERFCAETEDFETGPICYVANTFIRPEWRDTYVYKYLRSEFFRQNFSCSYFVGEALRKKS